MSLQSSARSGAMVAALFACSLATAQDPEPSTNVLPGFDLERLETNVGRGTLLVGSGELMVPGGLHVSLLGHYQRLPLVLNDGEGDLQVVRNRATAQLSAAYGVLPWLEVSAQLPFVLWQQGDDPSLVGLGQLSAQGLGTPVLQARLGLLSRRQRQPVDLSADLGVGLPFGNGTALAGDDGPRFHARMTVGTTLGPVASALEAGVLFRPSILLATSAGAAKQGANSEIRLGAALATTGKGLRGELGLRATMSPQVSMDLLGGVRFPLPAGLEASLLGGPGLGGALGAPRFRVLAGVGYRSEPPPKLSFIDENADRELQLALATPERPKEDERTRPVGTWELNNLSRGDPQDSAGQKEPQEPLRPYQPTPQEKVVLRGVIPFTKGSAEVAGVVPLLDQAVLQLSELAKGSTVIIEGHADTEGTEASDTFMSLRRAQAVRRYLVNQGVPATHVRIRGFGADYPVSAKPAATEEERQLNRRAEVLVLTDAPPTSTTTEAPSP